MVDPVSAVFGAVLVAVVAGILYAAYLRGASDATNPDHIVDMREVRAYHTQVSSTEALRQDVNDSEGG